MSFHANENSRPAITVKNSVASFSACLLWRFTVFVMLPTVALAQVPSDISAGKLIFNNVCQICCNMRQGDHRRGTNQRNILGRKAGSILCYGYSTALASEEFFWDEATPDLFTESLENFIS